MLIIRMCYKAEGKRATHRINAVCLHSPGNDEKTRNRSAAASAVRTFHFLDELVDDGVRDRDHVTRLFNRYIQHTTRQLLRER